MSKLTPQSQTVFKTADVHLLVVEDNFVNQRVTTRILERLGCRVDVTANGQEAIEATANSAFDLVFMDCQMPVMDGYEATRRIRQRETSTGRHLPIIALTANAMHWDREKCLDAGMDDYISKPVDQGLLLELLQKWLPASSKAGLQTEDQNERQTAGATTAPVGVNQEAFNELLALCDVKKTPEVLCDILEAFLQDTQEQLTALHQAVNESDAARLEQVAHTLKSSSSNVAALGMARQCMALQMLGRAGSVKGATNYIQQLESEFTCVRNVFVKECEWWRKTYAT